MSTATHPAPAPAAPPAGAPPATRLATVAMLALAAENLAGYLLLAGQPNPGMAAASVLPLAAAAALHARRRWAPLLALASTAVLLGLRMVELSFDLVRPGSPAPFALAALQLLTAGVAVTSSAVLLTASRRGAWQNPPGAALLSTTGLAVAAATGLGLVVLSPQGEDTGSLTGAQIQALPTVSMQNYRFEAAQLRAGGTGPVAFRFTNPTDDSHSFAIEALGLDVEVPSGRERVVVLDAPPGEYVFHCSVDSHREDGMEGRLVVTGTGTAPAAPTAAPAAATAAAHAPGHSHG